MNKIVIVTITALSSALMACSSAPTSNAVNYGVPFVNRTLPERMIDEGIEHTVLRNLPNVAGMEQVSDHQMRMAVDSFRREVLLTGEVPNPAISQNISTMISSMKDVTKIYNYLNVGVPKTQAHTLQDSVLKSRILARLVTDRSIKSSQYKLVVRDSTVYVMGYLTQEQQDRIMNAIRQTPGIGQVVLLSNLVTYVENVGSPYANYGNNNTYNSPAFNNVNGINGLNTVNTGINNAYNNLNNTINNGYNNAYNNINNGINTGMNNAYNHINNGINNAQNTINNGINNTLNGAYNNINNINNGYSTGVYTGNLYNTPTNTTPYNGQNTYTPPNTNVRPTSSYVQLYSGTNMPWCCGMIDYLV